MAKFKNTWRGRRANNSYWRHEAYQMQNRGRDSRFGYARWNAGRYARRAGGYVKSYQTRANKGFGVDGFKVYPDIPLGAGVVVGLSDVDRMIPGEAILLGASLPIGGKYGRSVRNFFGGIVLGELISKVTKFKIPLGTAKTDSVTGFYA